VYPDEARGLLELMSRENREVDGSFILFLYWYYGYRLSVSSEQQEVQGCWIDR